MIESLKARWILFALSALLALICLSPNFISTDRLPYWPSKNKLVYGLDIQGGLRLVLSANVEELARERLLRIGSEIQKNLEKEGLATESVSISSEKPLTLSLNLKEENQIEQAEEWINKQASFTRLIQRIRVEGRQIQLAYYETRLRELKEQAVQQSIEVIRSRIDEFGVTEPLISAQGTDRILVQLPGIKDSKKAKDLIQRTARLEMAIVNEDFPPEKLIALITKAEEEGGYQLEKDQLPYRTYIKRLNRDLEKELPDASRIVFEKAANALSLKAGKLPWLLDMSQSIQGGLLEDASVGFDPQFNQPLVSFRFQPEGRKQFADLTARSIGKKLAVVLDNVLKSAPVVESRISGDGQISLGGGNYEEVLEEAESIAVTLRAGALPAELTQLEEKTIGPTLGQDSIRRGKMAGVAGLILIMFFMLLYYKSFGLIANVALGTNMFFLLSILSSLSATLTLPGVAGIILTIGMAVDANVIIFERIKEELKKGASFPLGVRDGFGNAFSAILDANITTAIVCFVLIYFGSGPVRGFAVTLFCGILSSLWTSVFLSRLLMDFLILRFNWGKNLQTQTRRV